MSFVTDEIVEVACDAWERSAGRRRNMMRNALEAAAPLWLAHVRAASEHTADYQMAAAAAELRATIDTPAGPASTGGTDDASA